MTGFERRGVIEGFYGPPWTHAQRLDMIAFIGGLGLNTFFHTPKDDPTLRAGWRHGDTGGELAELASAGADVGVDVMIGISPGLSMRYADPGDNERLLDRIDGFVDLGFRRVAVLFDDIPARLQHPVDVATFAHLVDAHAAVVRGVHARFATALDQLAVCPTEYWGPLGDPLPGARTGVTEYLTGLGAGIPDDVDIFWTGRAICSPEITAAEAADFTRITGHRPLIWDNYPVNDVAMVHEFHIGPHQRRDPGLAAASAGLLLNAMAYAEASKIAIATAAEFLTSPDTYEPQAAWQRALRRVGGDTDAEAWALFGDAVRTSCLSEPDPLVVTEALERFAFETAFGDASAAAERLRGLGERIVAVADHLAGDTVANRALAAEARPWLEAFRLGGVAVVALAEGDPHRITRAGEALAARPQRVFGDVLTMAIAEATNG